MSQIFILMLPVLWTALIYTLVAPTMKLAPYKIALILFFTSICMVLSLRIKDKIVAQWLGIVLHYQARPKYWLYNKNDSTNRVVDVPEIPNIGLVAKKSVEKVIQNPVEVDVADLMKLEQLINTGRVAVRYQFGNKGI